MVKVAMSQSAWQAPLLETHEEFEDQLALQNPLPDSAHLHRRMQNPRTTSGLDNPNVYWNRFPPAAGNSCTAQFQQFHTGTPPGYATTVSVQPVTNSQQCEQQQRQLGDQQLTSTSAGHSYNEHLKNILDGVDPPFPSELLQRQQQQFAATSSAEYPGKNDLTFFGTMSDPGCTVEAPPALGLGMATVEMAQDPNVAALATAHQP
jgi:hypothetical protein